MASTFRPMTVAVEQRRSARIDWPLLFSSLVLLGFGLMSLFSEGITRDNDANFKKQVLFALLGLGPFALFAIVNPKFWERCAAWLYGVNLLSLIAVLKLGATKKGAERWIEIGSFQFQPSEMAKLLTILTLAAFFASRYDQIDKPSTYLLSFVHILFPVGLILAQPHLGAAMVIVISWFAISLIAQVPLKFIGVASLLFVFLVGTAISVPGIRDKLLHDYQKDRVSGLLDQHNKNRNYQTDRAELAFGEGGIFGAGYLHGEEKARHFIPEQHTDFIFTVVGEEGGLVGATLVLAAFGLFFYRIWLVMLLAKDLYFRMVAGGIFAALFFHTFVNLAMVLKMVPVVGLWLPFFSYGGTALWLCFSCVGLLLSIRRRERPVLFS